MPDLRRQQNRRAKLRRARIRNFLFTVGPERLARGRLSRQLFSNDIVVREIETSSRRWPKSFDGLRIGHVSDFHLGELITLKRATEAIDLLAAQRPDFVACTGDVVDLHHYGAKPLLEKLASIDAPLGVALVLGNHDELHCPDTITSLAREAGILVLNDQAAQIRYHRESLLVAGISWAKSASACGRRVEEACGEEAHLLLAHNPKAFLRSSQLDIPLTLSGHTHGGQVAMKNRPNTSIALGHRHRAGLFKQGASCLFVTTGVGAWFPLRVNCPAEVAVVTMRHEEAAGE